MVEHQVIGEESWCASFQTHAHGLLFPALVGIGFTDSPFVTAFADIPLASEKHFKQKF